MHIKRFDFTLLYAAGLRLENARAATERDITDGLVPPLEDHQFEALKSATTLHGVFISATAEGQDLLADAERFEMTRENIAENYRDIVEIIQPLVDEPDIIDPKTPQTILDVAQDNAHIDHPERRTSYTYAAVSNLLIVLSGYAVIGLVADVSGWAAALAALAGAGMPLTRSQRGKDAREFALKLISDLTDLTDIELQKALRRGGTASRVYILRHEAALRRLATRNKRFIILHDILDWLKKHPN